MASRLACDCGWRSKLGLTLAQAEHSARRHSCDRQRERVARRDRVAARVAADGPKRPCLHKVARHEHGTRAAFVLDRCHCRPCREVNTEAEQRKRKEIAYGRWQPYVDATPVRQHVEQLQAAGVGLKRIAALSGVAHGVLSKLMYGDRARGQGPSRRVRPETADAILAVNAALDVLGATVPVDATGTRRRLQALVAAGWSQSKLAVLLGMLPTNFGPLVTPEHTHVRAATARSVRELYARLADQAPPEANHRDKIAASRSRRYAADRGWLSPAWWDDDALDDPEHSPASADGAAPVVDEVLVERALAGELARLTRDERREVARRVLTAGGGVSGVAAALRCSWATARSVIASLASEAVA